MSVIKEIEINNGSGTPITADLGGSAVNTDYDGTNSGLSSTDVQNAIDEVVDQNDKFVGTQAQWDALTEEKSKYNGKLVYITDDYAPGGIIIQTAELYTLDKDKWDEGVYDFESIYPASEYNLNIATCSSTTTEQEKAFKDAKLVGNVNSNQLIVTGTVPTIDIDTMLTVTRRSVYSETGQGHIIINDAGTEVPIRRGLQFVGAAVVDDGTNDKTVVTIEDKPTIKACYDEETALYSHVVGSIIYMNEHFYKVTSAIEVGDTIAVGTNVTASTGIAADTAVYIENLPHGSGKEDSVISVDSTAEVGNTPITKTITITAGDGTLSAVSSDTDVCTVSIVGTTLTITGVSSGTATITVSISETENYYGASVSIAVTSTVVKIVSWTNGTDAEIVALVQAADNGDINLYADAGWRVGDERVVTLSAMQASGTASNGVSYSVGETHVSQTVTLVLMNRGGKTLSGGGTCNFVFGLKNMLANNGTREGGCMNPTNTNAGGWNSCARRNWCNGAFYDAFPSTLRPILKQFINHTATGDSTAATDSTDWFALASEVEIFGATTYANATAETGNTQFEYYTTSANRIKKQGDAGSAHFWWERSPVSGNSSRFCRVTGDGGAHYGGASETLGLAPFGCL